MKKIIVTIVLVVGALLAVLVYRAETTFQDMQVEPATGVTEIAVDEAEAVAHFAQALRIPTISHDDRSVFDAQAFMDFHAFLESAYPLVHQYAQRQVINDYSLVYRVPGSDPTLDPVLFMSHTDVVPVEESTSGEWTYPAFSGTVADGAVWGRGAIDVKFGVVSLMEALELLLAENISFERDIYFAFGHDEEVGGKDGAAKIAEHFAGRGIHFDYVLDEGGAITIGLNAMVEDPVAVIGVVEKGYVNLHLEVDGAGGHSSAPPAQTALGILSRAIVRVEDNPFPADLSHTAQFVEYLGARSPFMIRLFMANRWLFAPLIKRNMLSQPGSAAAIRTTTAATMAQGSPKSNILPTSASAVINFRILPGETVDSVRQRVVELIDDERVQVRDEYGRNPSPVSPVDSRGFSLIATTIRAMDDEVLVAPYLLQGGTDAKYFYAVSDHVYRFLMFTATPRTLQYAHGIDEQVPVDEFMRAIRFYYHLIRQSTAA